MTAPNDEGQRGMDEPRNVKRIVWALTVACAGLFLADALYEKHSYFTAEHVFGFYAIYGFVACIILVLLAKWLRTFLMRQEDYYGDDDA